MKQVESKKPGGSKQELIAPTVIANAKSAHVDGTFDEKLPQFLETLKANYCTSDEKCLRWEQCERHRWTTTLRSVGRKLREVSSALNADNKYPYQKVMESVLS